MLFQQKPEHFDPRLEVVSCFFLFKNKILLLHRQNKSMQGDTWGLPAGKKEADETTENAIIREIQEETGLVVHKPQINLQGTLYVRYQDYDFIYYTFHTSFETQPEITLNQTEHRAYKWVTPQEALTMNLITDLDACIKLFFKIEE